MTEDEALDKVDQIGRAFENDVNDGEEDGGPDWDGVGIEDGQLVYSGSWQDGRKIEFRWAIELVEHTEEGPDNDTDN